MYFTEKIRGGFTLLFKPRPPYLEARGKAISIDFSSKLYVLLDASESDISFQEILKGSSYW